MESLTINAADEKRVKALGFLRNKGTNNFSGRIITVNGKLQRLKTNVYQKLLSFLEMVL